MTETITYNEKEYPVRMGYYALKHTTRIIEERRKQDKNVKELTMENLMSSDIEILEPLLFYSLKMGAKKENVEFTFELEDMEFVLDECMTEFVEIIGKSKVDNELLEKSPARAVSQKTKSARTK